MGELLYLPLLQLHLLHPASLHLEFLSLLYFSSMNASTSSETSKKLKLRAARRLTFELNQGQLYAEREAALRQEVREMQFEHDLSLQASQQLSHWEQNEAAAYQARLNLVENQCSNAATRHLLEVEEQALHHFQHLREGLAQDEQTYRAAIQQEARLYSQSLQQELQYHMNAQAQAESLLAASLLAAERQNVQTTLTEQTTQWEAALHQVTEMAEEAVEQERTKTVEAEVDVNVFRLELQESQQELQTWTDWYGDLPEAETSEQQEDLHPIAGEQSASLPAISEVPGASPLTPPVVQHPTLQSRHLPPANLPFSDISARIAAETQRAEEVSQEQEEARRVLQQAELSASQTQLERERESELQQARRTLQLLEENQVGSGAPSFTPTLTSPPQGFTSHLTPSSHPVPATPANLRGPWAATRERLQQTSVNAQAISSPCLSVPSSSGLPSLSGACSIPGVACPVFASPTPVPTPATPYQGLPHLQMPLQPPPQQPTTRQQDEGKIDFKREKSALPKLQIKGGDATSITRTIHEWLQRTSLTLNTWSASAVQLWHNAVAVAKAAHQQWTSMTPSQRALQTGLPSTGHALPAQLSVLEAIMRSDLCNHCLPEKI